MKEKCSNLFLFHIFIYYSGSCSVTVCVVSRSCVRRPFSLYEVCMFSLRWRWFPLGFPTTQRHTGQVNWRL